MSATVQPTKPLPETLHPTGGDVRPDDLRAMRRAMVVVGLGTLMSSVDATVTNVALHTIGRDLDSSVAGVQWVVTGYLLSLASVIPVSGWIARRLGPRRLYTLALALFAASSGLCAFANSLAVLVAFRVLQGVAAGILLSVNQLIAAEVAGPQRMGAMMGRVWTVTAVGSVLGPVLGGVIIGGLGWRWIFLINVPIGAVATVAAFCLLPDTPPRPAGRLDIPGLVRLGLGVPSIVFALAQAEQTGSPTSPSALIPMIAGVALVCDFIRHALRREEPLLDLRLYARRTFATASLSLFCFNAAWFGVFILLPLYFQQVRHTTPELAGLLLAPQGIGTLAGSWVSGAIGDGARVRRLGGGCVLTFTAITIAFSRIGPTSPYWLICSLLLVAGFAGGLAWVVATGAGYAELASDQISHASPLVATNMRLGASVGTALAAIVLQRALNGGVAPGSEPHLVAAFHSTFQWAASAALITVVMFVALCRTESRWDSVQRWSGCSEARV